MKQVIQNETYGKIVYEESFWTGKKKLSINDRPLTRMSKKSYVTPDGEQMILSGNFLSGAKISVGSQTIQLTPKVAWYEVLLSLLPFVFIMVWGNSVSLCSIFPIAGGAIGGLIGALFGVLNLSLIKNIEAVWLKIVLSLVLFAGAVLVDFAIAVMLLALLVRS
ncbi:MAG: hypothetical protein J6125_03060 [Clostridia bacterium]|nr:hypothetical protein [Clostridia bacterium]